MCLFHVLPHPNITGPQRPLYTHSSVARNTTGFYKNKNVQPGHTEDFIQIQKKSVDDTLFFMVQTLQKLMILKP